MKEFDYVITSEVGLHARPAMRLAQEANRYISSVKVQKEYKTANAKSVISLFALSVNQGDQVRVLIEGEDEEVAEFELKKFFNEEL